MKANPFLHWAQAITSISQQIAQRADLTTIWQETVDAVQQVLDCDRTLLYQFTTNTDLDGEFIAEAIKQPQWAVLGQPNPISFAVDWFGSDHPEPQVQVIANVAAADLAPSYADFLTQQQVQASLVAPILVDARLWGLLIVHHCTAPRGWQPQDIAGLQQITIQGTIAIQQANLVARLQTVHTDLADQIDAERQQVKAKLEESETRWQFALESTGDGVWDWDLQTNRVFFSPQWKAILGYNPDEIGDSLEEWRSRVHPDDLAQCDADIQRHLQGKTPIYHNEHRLRCKDGSYKWILDRGKVIQRSETGEPLRVIGTHSDITEHRRIHQKLEAERSLFIDGPTVVIRWGATPDWPIEYISPNVKAVLGYDPETLISGQTPFTALIHPDDVDQIQTEVDRFIAAQKPAYSQTYRLQNAQGEFRWIEDFTRVIYAPDGSVEQFLGYLQDQTERKATELALAQSEVRYRSIIETTPAGVWMLNAKGNTTFVNQQMADMLGYSIDEMVGADILTFIDPADQAEARRCMQRQQGKYSLKFRCKDSTVRWTSVSATPLWDPLGDYAGCIGLITDISQMIQLQEALQASKMQLSSILDSSLDGIMAFRSVRNDQGTIVDFEWLLSNASACDMVGKTPEQLVGQRLLVAMPGNQEEGLFDDYVRTVETGKSFQREFYYNHEGVESWFENVAVPLGDGFVVTFRNVTQIKQSEQALHRANQQLEAWVNDLNHRHTEMVTLSEISDFLQACTTVEEACHTIPQLVEILFPHCGGVFFMMRESRNRLEQVSTFGIGHHSQADFEPDHCWGLRRGQPHVVDASRASLRCRHIQTDNPDLSTLCIPMMAQGEVLGLLHISTEVPMALSEAKQRLAQTLAEQMGMAIANLKLQETLKHQSIRDPLTKLFNRRYLEESLTREVHLAARKQHTLGVILLDVDHFKRFNDTFGHDAGDFVLQVVGDLLASQVRGSDLACRYGGEEMILVLPEAGLVDTTSRADSLRLAISQMDLNHRGQNLGRLTASFGVAVFPQHGTTISTLIKAADEALYRAKEAGRNQVLTAL